MEWMWKGREEKGVASMKAVSSGGVTSKNRDLG